MAQVLVALVQAIRNIQSTLVNRFRKQNIAQVTKFNGYGNKDPAKWVKRFDAACLTNNWIANWQKDIARSFLNKSAF